MLSHVPRLRRYARALLVNRDRADDLVQDTLERVLRNASQFRPDTDLRAWLMTIMHNIFVNDIARAANAKVHIAVDTLGHLLALRVTPASAQDRDQVDILAEEIQQGLKDFYYPIVK